MQDAAALERVKQCGKTCRRALPGCPHACQAPCHPDPCPEAVQGCQQEVTGRCSCRRQRIKLPCQCVADLPFCAPDTLAMHLPTCQTCQGRKHMCFLLPSGLDAFRQRCSSGPLSGSGLMLFWAEVEPHHPEFPCAAEPILVCSRSQQNKQSLWQPVCLALS